MADLLTSIFVEFITLLECHIAHGKLFQKNSIVLLLSQVGHIGKTVYQYKPCVLAPSLFMYLSMVKTLNKFLSPDPNPDPDNLTGGPTHGYITSCV